jgi:hypothetical protein
MTSEPTEITTGLRLEPEVTDAPRFAGEPDPGMLPLKTEVLRLHRQLNRLQREFDVTRWELQRLTASLSWGITRPLRLLSSMFPKSAANLRPIFEFLLSDGRLDVDRLRGRSPLPGEAEGGEDPRFLHQHAEDIATLHSNPMFDADMYLSLEMTRTGAIVDFVTRWVYEDETLSTREYVFRRPCAGFHPQIYAHAHSAVYDTAMVNPLAHFIRSGRPDGPWSHDVITPASTIRSPEGRDIPRTALHAHFHFPELAEDFFRKISASGGSCDLLLSTDHAGKADVLRDAASRYWRGEVQTRVVRNRGRNIGAFLTGFGKDIASRYEIVGHVHSKRSLHGGGGFDPYFGERWREFIWQNLLGGQYPMMDIVTGHLAADNKLGIVFPEDPYLHHWDANRPIAERLAARMGISEPLPPFLDFPVGAMFWARTAALKPLFDLKLDWEDYPQEPVGTDGTILNAIERLLPFIARQAGYRFATTYVPGVTR